jgi:hypothetical protein
MKRNVVIGLFGALLVLVACGGSGIRPTPTPTAPPSQPGEPLLAVLQHYDNSAQGAAVALVGLDGTVRARATFLPRQKPYVGNVAVMLQSEAQVGRAGVYYADGNGVVRLLERSGRVTTVATFAMTPVQHELWYAVSPDGTRLLAGLLSVPAVVPGSSFPTLSGTWKFDLISTTAGGASTVLQHVESATGPDSPGPAAIVPIFPVGWTDAGPVAMVGAPLATQDRWTGGPLFTIDAAGKPAARVGGNDATSATILPSGLLPAVTGPIGQPAKVTIRDAAGAIQWTPAVDGGNALNLKLSPAGDAVTDGLHAVTRQGPFAVPEGFLAAGWIDSATLVGSPHADGNDVSRDIWYVTNQNGAAVVHHLGVVGEFDGVVPGTS